MRRPSTATATLLASWFAVGTLHSAASAQTPPLEVFEIGADNTDELPRGKEADGIIGDFVLRNAHVEALVSADLPNRKANMGTDWQSPTPGCLYDLCVRGSANDQLTYLGPGGLTGAVSSVRITGPPENALRVPGVRVRRSAASDGGREQVHDYLLGADWRFLTILSTYRNLSSSDWKVNPDPKWKEFTSRQKVRGIFSGDAMNPTDRQGYAAASSEWQGSLTLGEPAGEVVLQPGQEKIFITVVAPGRSPAEAYGVVAALRGETGRLKAKLREEDRPVVSASLSIPLETTEKGNRTLKAYPDLSGELLVALPLGTYRVTASDIGRPSLEKEVTIAAGQETELDFPFEPASRVAVQVTDPDGERLPAKVQFIGIGGTEDPYFGVDIQARGCRNVYQSPGGNFVQQVPPGSYRVVITRGIEYDHVEREIEVGAGQTVHVSAQLERIVYTPGWVSTDYHNHSTPSGDNYCGTDDRVINLAVEQIEFAPTTEHNRLYDWQPHIRKLGLEKELRTIVGIELTGPNAHFNSFPLEVKEFLQDGGAPTWRHDPRINAIVLRDYQGGGPHRWVHLNHPHVGRFFRDRNSDGLADGGYGGLAGLVDAAEVWSLEILNPTPRLKRTRDGKEVFYENRTFAWLQLLNQGVRMGCIAVSDAHAVFGNSVGGWRTYVKSSVDEPDRLDPKEIIRNSKAGRMFVTTGPYLEVALDDGTQVGGQTIVKGPFHIEVKVQCTDWIDIDRVQVLVNGRLPAELNFTRQSHPDLFGSGVVKFQHRIPVALQQDAHLIVAAVGESFNLRTGYGKSPQSNWNPCAFTNPIYVDVDGHGFEASGDNLGQPLPHGK